MMRLDKIGTLLPTRLGCPVLNPLQLKGQLRRYNGQIVRGTHARCQTGLYKPAPCELQRTAVPFR